jgi:hypothetical protein
MIWLAWTEMQSQLYEKVRDVELKVSGDGQFDSPGYSAAYCFYTVVDSATDKVETVPRVYSIGDFLKNVQREIFYALNNQTQRTIMIQSRICFDRKPYI